MAVTMGHEVTPAAPRSGSTPDQYTGLPVPARPRRRVGRGAGRVLPQAAARASGASAATTRRRSRSCSRGTTAAAGTAFGYPACPNLEDQAKLFELIDPTRVGITLSEQFQLEPEQSTTAIVVHHPQAKYFNVTRSAGCDGRRVSRKLAPLRPQRTRKKVTSRQRPIPCPILLRDSSVTLCVSVVNSP